MEENLHVSSQGKFMGARDSCPCKVSKMQCCTRTCLSTCNYQVSHYSQSWLRPLQWVAKHAHTQFFGVA